MSRKFRDRIIEGTGYSSKKFECDFGMKLLQKMGWKEGNGLGKEQQGNTECIQIKKREEGLGLGIEQARKKFEWNDTWWENHYNNAIKSISVIKNEDSARTSDESDSDDENHKQKTSNKIKKSIGKKTKKGKLEVPEEEATVTKKDLRKLKPNMNYSDPKNYDHLYSSCSSSSDEEIVTKKSKSSKKGK